MGHALRVETDIIGQTLKVDANVPSFLVPNGGDAPVPTMVIKNGLNGPTGNSTVKIEPAEPQTIQIRDFKLLKMLGISNNQRKVIVINHKTTDTVSRQSSIQIAQPCLAQGKPTQEQKRVHIQNLDPRSSETERAECKINTSDTVADTATVSSISSDLIKQPICEAKPSPDTDLLAKDHNATKVTSCHEVKTYTRKKGQSLRSLPSHTNAFTRVRPMPDSQIYRNIGCKDKHQVMSDLDEQLLTSKMPMYSPMYNSQRFSTTLNPRTARMLLELPDKLICQEKLVPSNSQQKTAPVDSTVNCVSRMGHVMSEVDKVSSLLSSQAQAQAQAQSQVRKLTEESFQQVAQQKHLVGKTG